MEETKLTEIRPQVGRSGCNEIIRRLGYVLLGSRFREGIEH
jgi:hypothetical protein